MADKERGGIHSALRTFLDSEAAGGLLLILAAAAAMVIANSPLEALYHHALHDPLGWHIPLKQAQVTPHLLINDGLMAIFFLFVGLEIKRELVDGRLSTWSRRRLPVIAAASGMAVPAAVYLFIAAGTPGLAGGWAIPAATDIAFAMAVLALLGSRAPTALKLFLTTVAIVDDMGAVAIIALAYTSGINTLALGAAAGILLILYIMGKSGVHPLWPYVIGAALLWYALLLSGVHATVAGVLAAAAVPVISTPGTPDSSESPLHRLEHALARPVALLIVPLFGFANAGVSLSGLGLAEFLAPLPLGIAAGLLLGKQIGIFGAVWLSVRFGFATMLRGASWLQLYGVSLLCGIGFTMSLFIGSLAFPSRPDLVEQAKVGILFGSLLSALAGYLILRVAPPALNHQEEEARQRSEILADGDVQCMERP